MRAAQKIANIYTETEFSFQEFSDTASNQVARLFKDFQQMILNKAGISNHPAYREEFQQRMTHFGSHIRQSETVKKALEAACEQVDKFLKISVKKRSGLTFALQNRHLVLSHVAYLEAIRAYLEKDGGSRGSYMVMDKKGEPVLDSLGDDWRYKLENPDLQDKMAVTVINSEGRFETTWEERRPIPMDDYWFETIWGEYLKKDVFRRDKA